MKPRLALALLPLLFAAPAAPQVAPPPAAPASEPAPDLSSPEAAIRSFVLSANQVGMSAVSCLVGGKVDQDVRRTREYSTARRMRKDRWLIP